ncbi:NEDD8 ultimate buster 1-like [Lineus longissimus]|uniref:NEDD8 ultimate buster 1-like n=1 Tax=Lineus longissimus TaxID=88925 RepID=UPI002B4C4FBF
MAEAPINSNSIDPTRHEEIQHLLREKLNREKVKLWLPPYTHDTTGSREKGQIPTDLIDRYSKESGLTPQVVGEELESLRLHALEKLDARKKFEASGVATLRVKLAGKLPSKLSTQKRTITLEVLLGLKGHELKRQVAEVCGIEACHLKLITCGHVIDDGKSLIDQHVKNNSQVMAIFLSESEAEARRREGEVSQLSKTRAAAELLSKKEKEQGDPYMQIADQSGKTLNLPDEERKALTMAMTLNEKGRASLKRREYGLALLLLLEADKEFRKCRADILDAVDNYAILCLDIVWCYLCLKNVNDLPDAASRLDTCEDCFRKSYGTNLERLMTLKGQSGHVLALYVRLHLLQGVLAYYQHRRSDAIRYLEQSERELRSLQVDDEKMTQVMTMGFSQQEARLGLRACQGSVDGAIAHIISRREERKEVKKKEKEEKRLRRLLGKTADGKWVNGAHYKTLTDMGYPPGSAKEALRQSNSNITMAIQVLSENPELLELPDPRDEEMQVEITDEMIAQMLSLGFDASVCRSVLSQCSGNIERAVDMLLNGGVIPSSAVGEGTSGSLQKGAVAKTAEELQQEQEAIDEIIPDIPENEEDYLDISLEEEATFLEEFKALVSMIR